MDRVGTHGIWGITRKGLALFSVEAHPCSGTSCLSPRTVAGRGRKGVT